MIYSGIYKRPRLIIKTINFHYLYSEDVKNVRNNHRICEQNRNLMVDTPHEDRILWLRQVCADRITPTAVAFTYYISADRSAGISRLWCRTSLISAHTYLYRHLDRNHEVIRSSKLPRQLTDLCKFEFRFPVVVQILNDSLATLNFSYI